MVEKQLNAINVLHQGSSKARSLTGFGLATSIDQLACFPFQSCPGQKTTPEFCRKSEKLLDLPHLFQVLMEVCALQGVSKLNLDNAET